MLGALRFVGILVACLALMAWGAMAVVNDQTRRWTEKDLRLRAQLAVSGSRRALLDDWREGAWKALGERLADITHDERIMAAAACEPDRAPGGQHGVVPDPALLRGAAAEASRQQHRGAWAEWRRRWSSRRETSTSARSR